MKKLKTRLIPLVFLTFTSITAYFYLNNMDSQTSSVKSSIYAGEEATEEQEIYLPDVEMVNKIIEAGKRIKSLGR
ncbi:MAG: hypothetical protein AAF960_23545 [Bacteroidota bacterium]